ncbi:hypothetical protein HS961_15195 [Comamonas piscis]|uniref:Uncharacterized protein n=1 Tax=Comamonas piscis TaxID=1562974 RepID=A0A7G5EJA0_9BURK|nr:hypothetical protein [Comamonas piscis]QMV74075.1 hypothetical protein HS961_15195 [Comamonas piscis]WSO32509.1 hypothetical protein VUJ63_15235 [Comamonas piscis]
MNDAGSLAENPVSKDEQWLLCTSALAAVLMVEIYGDDCYDFSICKHPLPRWRRVLFVIRH